VDVNTIADIATEKTL